MTEEEATRALAKAMGDQGRAMLYQHKDEICEVAQRHPNVWSSREQKIAQMVLLSIAGLLSSGDL